jgi:GTP1/Obg family GTP-binding protein
VAFVGTKAYQKTVAKQLLAKSKMELYEYFINNIASSQIKAKCDKGKRACFGMWKRTLEKQANDLELLVECNTRRA